ncbi:MAG: hypothetical protein OEZ36_08680, partial [Spirochaetota bacterium]|nr:hypothetical protein [Spirochaetota bacterium]
EKKAILMDEDRKALYFVDLKNIIKRVQYLYSTHSVEIRKVYPDTLFINILETNLVAYLLVKDRRGITGYGLNSDGQVISVHKNMSKQEIHHPVIQCLLKDTTLRHKQGKLLMGKYIRSESLRSVIRSLSMMKKTNVRFFRKIVFIRLTDDSEKNWLKLRELKTQFYFGQRLSPGILIKIHSLEEDLSTRINLTRVDLRFNTIVGRK